MPTAVLYLRLSRDSEKSDSLEGQEADCRRRATELGATDVVVFKETVSGYRSVKRKAFDAMTSYVRERRPAFLIAWKFDRFSRQGIRQVADVSRLVEDTGVRFICLRDHLDSHSPEWELMAAFAAHQARGESRNTSLRVAARKARDRKRGQWKAMAPYGYAKTEDFRLVQRPEQAAVVRRIVAEFLDGRSMRAIAMGLTADNVLAPGRARQLDRVAQLRSKGRHKDADELEANLFPNVWTVTAVRKILSNPPTAGLMVHKGSVVLDEDGEPIMVTDAPIITMAERRRILARLERNVSVVRKPGQRTGGKASPGRPPKFLLTGFIRCGDCGWAMSCRDERNRHPGTRPRYFCVGRSHGHNCATASIVADDLERAVADLVVGRLAALEPDDPALVAVAERWLAKNAPEYRAERDELSTRADTLRGRLEDLESARWERGEFDDAEGPARYARFRARIAEQLSAVENALKQLPEPSVNVSALLDPDAARDALSNNDAATLAQRRDVLALVLDEVIVYPDGRLDPVWASADGPEHVPVTVPVTA